ncbi:hypothetical protein C1X95_31705, partial [Pseudomonas sp. FW306-2-11AD]
SWSEVGIRQGWTPNSMKQVIGSKIGQGAGCDAVARPYRFHPRAAPANQRFGRRPSEFELMAKIVEA